MTNEELENFRAKLFKKRKRSFGQKASDWPKSQQEQSLHLRIFGKLRETIAKIRSISSRGNQCLRIIVHKSPIVLFTLCFADADESAAQGSHHSHDYNVNADCNNTAGSYACPCKPTYFGNGKICTSFREFLLVILVMMI